MRSGWVKLSRAVLDDPLLNKDPEHLALWIHLLCNAAFEPTPALLGGKRIILQPGQLTTGRKQLALNSGIDENKVQRVLKAFENAQLIEQQTTNQNRLISIVSWVDYLESEQQTEQPMNNERTTGEQQVNTLEEIKNIRTEELRKREGPRKSSFVPPTVEEVREYCQERKNFVNPQRFVDYYEARGWMVGKSKMKSWQAAVRTWEQREKEGTANDAVYNSGSNQRSDWDNLPGVVSL